MMAVTHDIPVRLETQRLILRCPRAGDGEIVYASIAESLDDLRKFPASQPWVVAEQSAALSEARCRDAETAYIARVAFPMMVLLKHSGEHVGNVGIHTVDWAAQKCAVGYWCRSGFTGNGYITEALIAVTQFAFTQLEMRRVEAHCDELNVASWRVCERARFTFRHTVRDEAAHASGSGGNTRVYAANG
jgi:RimJ/RimL family protein N-acetyltransferase